MKKKLLFHLIVFFFYDQILLAQNRKISGVVTAGDSNKVFNGATITVKGTAIITSSNAKGEYSLIVPASATKLVFSAAGSKTLELAIEGRSVIDVKLKQEIIQLEATVVTALGIKGERDKFASSASTLKGDNIARSGETGVLNGLSGKASGVIVTRNGGDPGAGSYIQIRGQNTISGNAQPLFIVDGMPVSNASDNIGAARSNGIVQQSRINDINVEDIERVEVLKGASAAALWGSRAANGVIILTTKKGRNTNGKLNIFLKSTYSIDRVNKMHPLQTRYGQGTNGFYNQGNRASFGDLIADRNGGTDQFITSSTAPGYQGFVVLSDGSMRFAIPAGNAANPHGGKNARDIFDHATDAFETGHFLDNTLNISGGNDRSNILVSYGDLNQQGVIKNFSNYNRKTARVNVVSRFTDWFSASANVGYTKIKSSRVQEGDNVDGILLSSLRTPPDFNNGLFTGTYTDINGQVFRDEHVSYRNPLGKDLNTIYANPLWNIHNNRNSSEVDRYIGTIELNLTPVNWLTTTGRFGVDNFTDNRLERFARNSANFSKGYLSKNWISEKQFNTDLFATAKKTFCDNFGGSLLAGFNYNSRRRATLSDAITNFIIPNAPDILTNALNSNLAASNYNSLLRTYGFYAQADVEIYKMVYFTFTGRNEYASTFGAKTKNSFFFPSAALAWQFSQLKTFSNQSVLSFGKLRATWGQVGIQPQPYQNFTNYSTANYRDDFTSGLSGISTIYNGGYVRSTTEGNEFLKPEIKTEREIGLDLRFFKNRITVSATGYSNRTTDVILPISVPAATGYTTRNANAAELKNNGVEFEVSANIIRSGSFRWNVSANYSKNKNKVVSLAGAKAYTLPDSFIENASLVTGQPFGVFLSTDFLKDPKGNYVLDTNGFPQAGTDVEVIGDPNPDWRGGIGSTFSYKDFSLYVLFDKVAGNDFFNGTRGSLYAFGTHGDQGNTVVAPVGVLKDVNGITIPAGTSFQGQIGNFGAGPVAINQAWWQGRGAASNTASYKQFVEDGSASRLRELTISYSLQAAKFKRFSQLSGIDFSITGRNLVLWTNYRGTDPEVNVSGAGLARGQDWFTNPNTKSVLFSIVIKY
jgi:TonB-linked SusC/RagA family outer membrane protein